MYDAVIVGAGVAGLTAARGLVRADWRVLVLEKSRGLGGRAATRRLHGNRVDHGAQYFTARSQNLQTQVESWLKAGYARVWQRGFHTLSKNGLEAPQKGHPRYIFPGGMNTIGKLLAEDVQVERETKVSSVQPAEEGWSLRTEGGETFKSRYVILNAPAEQARELCHFDLELDIKEVLERVTMQPCFALMAGFPRELRPEWYGVRITLKNHPLAWLALDSSKRDEPKDAVLVVHSSHPFANSAFSNPPEQVESALLRALNDFDERFSEPLWTNMQRWRYAQVDQNCSKPFLRQDSLLFCGDWCGGAKLEAAYLSGLAVAQTLAPTGKTTNK